MEPLIGLALATLGWTAFTAWRRGWRKWHFPIAGMALAVLGLAVVYEDRRAAHRIAGVEIAVCIIVGVPVGLAGGFMANAVRNAFRKSPRT